MKGIKKLMAEFKAFITRGNVVDMAVAVIIGAAFGAIVTALTNGILQPIINWAVGGKDGAGLYTMLKTVYTLDAEGNSVIDMAKSIYIDWGTFIMKIVDFILIALVLFIIIKIFMSLKNASAKASEKAKQHREKMVEKLKKQGMSEAEAQAQVAKEEAAEAAVAPAPTVEELLSEIRDLLAKQEVKAVPAQAENTAAAEQPKEAE